MTIDNPLIRAMATCPMCGRYKRPGLVTCWPCFNAHDLKNGNPDVEAIIAQHERDLAAAFPLTEKVAKALFEHRRQRDEAFERRQLMIEKAMHDARDR